MSHNPVFLRKDRLKNWDVGVSRSMAVGRGSRAAASDLKITFPVRDALFARVASFDLHALDFFVDLVEPLLKLQRFDLHPDFAALADDMGFTVMFEVAHKQRILEATLRASDVHSFVFKHFLTSPQRYRTQAYFNPPRRPNASSLRFEVHGYNACFANARPVIS
jgi:hypothetical protein